MSGIYIHIPFCKQACHYCNFHFSTSLRLKDEMIDAICQEIRFRKDYLKPGSLDTIYFGGGTPSILTEHDFDKIFSTLSEYYTWDNAAEITLEANPDDINAVHLQTFKKFNINRLSIGIQSFFDEDLRWMHRAHNAYEATNCVKLAQDLGYDNITIDLIYGSPTTTDDMWEQSIQKTLNLHIPHISAYGLTVEEKTALYHAIKKNKTSVPDPVKSAEQFHLLMTTLEGAGYDHYEISNFAIPGKYAVHNTNYWKGIPYLGIGPSAHSYNIATRSWNIANNKKYIDLIIEGSSASETEIISEATRYNEYIMTGLRTIWGVNTEQINKINPGFVAYFLEGIETEIQSGFVYQKENNYFLTSQGKNFADRVAMNLFFVH